ncbi:TraA family conjugative transfer protein [Marinobacter goseongensis]|uniref:TraA family conjugative transfer protein n=1 Tax=Marinobacter goseongensis TaxID=453838 RepID=UPI00200416E8|nr:TraA family conjugative transfer protein [Marinobacter goseongensis]MCK7553391.1 TrbC/VirB2 family protein [Marinobacter goseongensis]
MKTTLQRWQQQLYMAAKRATRYTPAFLLLALPSIAMASGAGGREFDDIWDTLEGWVQGTLGRIIALVMVLVGIVFGIARQNIMAFVMGPAAGIGLFYAPSVIQSIMGASL